MSKLPLLLDFQKNPTETLSLDMLRRTYLENDPITQLPLRGIHHYQLIDRVTSLLDQHKLTYRIEEIFAANNKDRNNPGVVVSPTAEEKYGKGSIESHCLRRVYTTIKIENESDEETETGLAIAFHQNGIQVAIGPNVKICRNQCILSKDRYVATYGENKVKDLDKLFQVVDDWLHNFSDHRAIDMRILEQMKNVSLDYRQVAELVGHLTYYRVGYDSGLIKNFNPDEISMNTVNKYPLNNSQINDFVHAYLTEYERRCIENIDTIMSLYDVYNIATNLYKADKMVIPNIMTQNLAWTEILTAHYLNVEPAA